MQYSKVILFVLVVIVGFWGRVTCASSELDIEAAAREAAANIKRVRNNLDESVLQAAAESYQQTMVQSRAYNAAAEGIRRQSFDQLRAEVQLEQQKDKMADKSYVLFVSWSMGETELKHVLWLIAGDESVVVAFRGILPGERFIDGMKRIHALIKDIEADGIEKAPNIVLNPVLFRDHAVSVVPTIVALKDDGSGNAEARVTGLHDPAWLRKKRDAGEASDFGERGPVLEIVEEDLIERMKRSLDQQEWEAKKRLAYHRSWNNQAKLFRHYPLVKKTAVRWLTPIVEASNDIRSPSGEVIIAKGERVNMLDKRDFNGTLLIFDPTRAEEISRVNGYLDKHTPLSPMLIATQFHQDHGWEGYKSLTEKLDQHVYLITADVARRFRVRRTPLVVTAEDAYFKLHEIGDEYAEEGSTR